MAHRATAGPQTTDTVFYHGAKVVQGCSRVRVKLINRHGSAANEIRHANENVRLPLRRNRKLRLPAKS